MITGAENIAKLFSIFHDGSILGARRNYQEAVFDIEISYLAQRVNPKFSKFSVRLMNAENFTFKTWENDPPGTSKMLVGFESIFQHDLEVLNGEATGDRVQVVCNAPGTSQGFCGGELQFHATAVEVTDESGGTWSLERIDGLSRDYWNEWSNRNRGDDV